MRRIKEKEKEIGSENINLSCSTLSKGTTSDEEEEDEVEMKRRTKRRKRRMKRKTNELECLQFLLLILWKKLERIYQKKVKSLNEKKQTFLNIKLARNIIIHQRPPMPSLVPLLPVLNSHFKTVTDKLNTFRIHLSINITPI